MNDKEQLRQELYELYDYQRVFDENITEKILSFLIDIDEQHNKNNKYGFDATGLTLCFKIQKEYYDQFKEYLEFKYFPITLSSFYKDYEHILTNEKLNDIDFLKNKTKVIIEIFVSGRLKNILNEFEELLNQENIIS